MFTRVLTAVVWLFVGVVVAVVALFAYEGFTAVRQRTKQFGTYSDLQRACLEIGRVTRDASSAEEYRQGITRVMADFSLGTDRWGHPIVWRVFENNEKVAYLIASPGKDGRFDVDDTKEYLAMKPRKVTGAFDSDIVFVNGRAVTLAGK